MHKQNIARSRIVFLCSLLSVSSAVADNIPIHLDFPTSFVNEKFIKGKYEGNPYQTLGDWEMDIAEGNASLPVCCKTIQIPANAGNVSVGIESISWGGYMELTSPLMINEGLTSNLLSNGNEEKNTAQDESESPIEEQMDLVKIVNDYYLNGQEHFICVEIHPFVHDGLSSVKLMKDIDIRLSYQLLDIGKNEILLPSWSFKPEDSANKIMYAEGSVCGTATSETYIIVTTEALRSRVEELAVWKRQKGLTVKLRTIEEILEDSNFAVNTTFGRVDGAASLRSYLRREYEKSGEFYCVLIGPTSEIPVRYFYERESRTGDYGLLNHDNFVPSDIYYADLLREWNLRPDIEGIYSIRISDNYFSPCIHVGRIVCSVPEEFGDYFRKLRIYEAFPGKGDDEYLSNGLVVKQNQHLGYADLVSEIGTLEVTSLKSNCGNSFASNLPTGTQVIREMGKSGLISLQGHGGPGNIATSGANGKGWTWRFIKAREEYDERLWYGDYHELEAPGSGLNSLGNEWKPSVLYSMSCDVMPFDVVYDYSYPYNMGTSFTVGGLYGGVAFLGNTRLGRDMDNQKLETKFAEKLLINPRLGPSYYLAKVQANMGAYAKVAHNIIGDPEMEIWRSRPMDTKTKIELSDTSVAFDCGDFESTKISIDDGFSTRLSGRLCRPDGTIDLESIGISRQPYVASLWKTGYLPEIKLKIPSGVLSGYRNNFFVKDAFAGDEGNVGLVIQNNSHLVVSALNTVRLEGKVMVDEGCSLLTSSGHETSVNILDVEDGASVEIRAESVILDSFNIQTGCSFRLNNE